MPTFKSIIITSYKQAVVKKEFKQRMAAKERFKCIEEREDRSDIPPSAWLPLAVRNAYWTHWKNAICNKSPTEFALYPMLIQELKPKTILELGAMNGGSALWLADLLTLSRIKGHVYSVDIALDLIEPSVKKNKKITFIEGDCTTIEKTLPKSFLNTLPHPWLVIEDCHINLEGILNHLHKSGLQIGDYLIVEDTNKDALRARNEPSLNELYLSEEQIQKKARKMDDLRQWLENNPGYKIDTFYSDMFGYNGSKNWNSILKKTSATLGFFNSKNKTIELKDSTDKCRPSV